MRDESTVNGGHIPIPEVFFNSDTGRPFEECLVCGKHLLSPATTYIVEKAIRQIPEYNTHQIIFEYAICLQCAVAMNSAISDESRQRVSDYFTRNVNYERRRELAGGANPLDVNRWLEYCLVKNTRLADVSEYQMVAQCSGNTLHPGEMPFALSADVMDELTELLSPKSLGEMDDWIGSYFTGPPEVAALLRKRSPVLI